MSFLKSLEDSMEQLHNLQETENGATGFNSTNVTLLDMNFKVPSYRTTDPSKIIEEFDKAYSENDLLSVLWMFFVRDIRGGLGERRLFRILFHHLCQTNPETASRLLKLVPEYGRWDDVIKSAYYTPLHDEVVSLIKSQLEKDVLNYKMHKEVSLLAKWMPSERTSSKETRNLARQLASDLGVSIVKYNRTLSQLRKYLDVVECKMSAKNWESIDYSAVPSKANLLYSDAFLRNDEDRRRQYLDSLTKGNTKINSSTLFPHEIVHKYTDTHWYHGVNKYDTTLEELWKALPADAEGLSNTIVVADGSGSMITSVGNSKVTALDVANALAIYCSEHCKGEFKDKYITFSHTPQFVNLKHCNSLHDKIEEALRRSEVANTNIEAVFDLILDTAINTKTPQSDLPKNILIISDMEFDEATRPEYRSSYSKPSDALFERIKKRYQDAGYQVPRLVFWNVNSRTNTIPVTQNGLGVALVSGFSTSILKMVQDSSLDPFVTLVKTITSNRYSPIIDALN